MSAWISSKIYKWSVTTYMRTFFSFSFPGYVIFSKTPCSKKSLISIDFCSTRSVTTVRTSLKVREKVGEYCETFIM